MDGRVRSTQRTYVSLLERASREAVPTLARALGLERRAAAEAYGVSAGIVLAGLARAHRRGEAGLRLEGACGAAGDVDAPELAIGAHLARPRPDPRLVELLGDAPDRAGAWLAARTGAQAEVLVRAVAASAPLALCAAARAAAASDLPPWLAGAEEAPLEEPARLASGRDTGGRAYRCLRRAGMPWFERVLTLV